MESRVIVFFVIAVIAGLTQSASVKAAEQAEKNLPLPKPVSINGKTFYIEVWFKASWYRALQYCRYHGFNLASIGDSKENDALFQTLNVTAFNDLHFWTSANDIDQLNLYTWYSNGQNIMTYSNFKKPEPNHMVWDGEMELCIEVVSSKAEGLKWNDVRCSNKNYIICEK